MGYDYEKFRLLCESKGVNPNEVSKATGIATATFSEWKKGTYSPKVDKIRKLAEYFDVSEMDFSGKDNTQRVRVKSANIWNERLKKLRKESGLSTKDIADKLGVHYSTIYQYESGEISFIPYDLIDKYAEIFGVNPTYIVGWENKIHNKPIEADMLEAFDGDSWEIYKLILKLKKSPSMKHLIELARNADDEDIDAVNAIFERILK